MGLLHAGWVRGVAALAVMGWAAAAPAQQADLDREFEFASKLVEIGFADYAERLVDEIVRLNPDQKDRSKVLQVEILSSRRKFDDAEAVLKTMPAGNPKTQAARLALANGMYRGREVERATKQYQDFFKEYKTVPTDPDLKRFYMDAAYRFGQMLEKAGDPLGAVAAYENILKAKPEAGVARRIKTDLCLLLVNAGKAAKGEEQKKLFERAWKLCEEIQWGNEGIDIAFCQSIVTMANIDILRGKPENAAKLIRQNLDLMKGVDEFLKQEKLPLSESPLAYARFLLGELYEKEAVKAGKTEAGLKTLVEAFTQYVNVFIKYAESEWAAEAGARSEALKARIKKDFGKEIKTPIPPALLQKAVAAQYRLIDDMFIQKRYPETIKGVLKVLNSFPTVGEAGPLFTPLIISFAETKDALSLDVTVDYIAETRRADATSGLSLLALAKHYYDKKDEAGCIRMYRVFADAFPKHDRAPQVLFLMAGMMKKAGDGPGARKALQRIIDNYPQDQFFLKALSMLGWDRYEAQDYKGAAESFERFVQESPAVHNRMLALFSLADCYVRMEQFDKGAKAYGQVVEWLTPKENNPYFKTTDEVKKAADLLEKARFYVGYSLFKMPAEGEMKPKIRAAAVQTLEAFAKDYEKSDLAPKAINLVGAIQLDLGKSDEAAKTFEMLGKKWPASEDGKSALFSLIRAAIEIKRYDIAEDAFGKMMATEKPGVASKLYTPEQFVRVGQWMQDGKKYGSAVKAFEMVLAVPGLTDRTILERSLYGLGVAAYETGNKEKAIEKLEDMMQKYPRSGLFYEARSLLSKAYRETGKYPEAVATLNEIFKVANDPVDINRANMELARVQREFARKLKLENKQGPADESLGQATASYERIVLLADDRNEKLRPMIEEALREVIDVYEERARFKDAVEACDRYLAKFAENPAAADIRRRQQGLKLKAAAEAPAPAPAPAPGAPAAAKPAP
ncbi:MAG: tetratricopeptide repeat protein [Lentisphaerae bacterium]|nr:tetratricopeptide repeat protein [Lentisphaerota bacterium]